MDGEVGEDGLREGCEGFFACGPNPAASFEDDFVVLEDFDGEADCWGGVFFEIGLRFSEVELEPIGCLRRYSRLSASDFGNYFILKKCVEFLGLIW